MVPSSDAGIEIFVRNKRPADRQTFRPERTVLYVHGATYPASTAFDLKLDGLSWMEYIAARLGLARLRRPTIAVCPCARPGLRRPAKALTPSPPCTS